MGASSSVVLRERRAEECIDHAEDDRVGERLHPEGLAGRQSEEETRREEHEQKDGDDHVAVHRLSSHRKSFLPSRA